MYFFLGPVVTVGVNVGVSVVICVVVVVVVVVDFVGDWEVGVGRDIMSGREGGGEGGKMSASGDS